MLINVVKKKKKRLLKKKINPQQRQNTFQQETDKEAVNEKEEMVMSFSWQIENFHAHYAALMEERGDPLTSEQFQKNGYTWRAILTKDLNLYLQLVSASFPATVEIR